jgi:hypothetical protein
MQIDAINIMSRYIDKAFNGMLYCYSIMLWLDLNALSNRIHRSLVRTGLIGHVGTGVADIHFTNVSGQWTRHSEGKGSNRVLPIGSRK